MFRPMLKKLKKIKPKHFNMTRTGTMHFYYKLKYKKNEGTPYQTFYGYVSLGCLGNPSNVRKPFLKT